ncbi:MAG: DUF302 domain-containing protein [Candidatus Rokubacteria bacterium]|nr:DUF302 domain-containing protein [Candidatus Rokubacteria bacterium]MBI2014756.1 DUF302 domain-containing protein [Candidatus Rokubacteria bacterium]MBI2492575.1 DUF302 domain-containing protein [Candidatus Rokubacteria bacterium]MBI4629588.1 DUF302 domain-containing protein [Candidatus Rokubacteria bacterium]
MRGRRTARPLAAAALLLAAAGAAAAEPARRIERTDEFLVLRLRAPHAEVLEALRGAIARRNYVAGGTSDLGDALARRARTLGEPAEFDRYQVLSFCNLGFAAEALRVDPRAGALMPCRIAVFVVKGSAEVVVVALRPLYLARIVPAPEFARLAAQVEADLMAVLEEVAGE